MFGFKKNSKKNVHETFIKKGDIVSYGSFRNAPITWIVLDKKGDYVLLLSEFLLCQRCYSVENYLVKGQYSTLHMVDWLEQEIAEACFETTEHMKPQKAMDDSEHLVFLLSDQEVSAYLPQKENRIAMFSKLRQKDCTTTPGWWWTSSKGNLRNTMNYVDKDGAIKTERFQDNGKGGVRPAIWLNVLEAEKTAKSPEEAKIEYENSIYIAINNEEALKREEDEKRLALLKAKKEEEEKRRLAFEKSQSAEEHYETALKLIELASILGNDGPESAAKYAHEFLEISRKLGYRPASEKLAWMYENGIGCEMDAFKANDYLRSDV